MVSYAEFSYHSKGNYCRTGWKICKYVNNRFFKKGKNLKIKKKEKNIQKKVKKKSKEKQKKKMKKKNKSMISAKT